jgi:very-long-chain enoyl-CoA reductase
MGLCHFVKRVFECIFVHFYSKPSKSIGSIIREVGYYWLFFGILTPFYLLHPRYKNDSFWVNIVHLPENMTSFFYYGLLALFSFAEVMNLLCHQHLRSFRKRDRDFTRGIPVFHGYSVITCANYFWEFLAWVAFALVAQTFVSYIFVVTSFFRMNRRAHRKHHRYISQFKN